MHEEDEHEQDPAEVDPVDARLAGVLHEKRQSAEQSRQAQADDHAHDGADMREDFRVGRNLIHGRRSYSSAGTGLGLPFSSSATMTKIASVTFSMRCEER
ncbi:hypothetical protein D9M68_667240 [compost metagenome]